MLRSEVSEGPSRESIEQRFRTNSGLTVGARFVTAALSLATIPVVVSRLGVGAFGTWESLLALASLAAVFQVAVSGTLVWRISEAYGRGDAFEIRRLVRVGASAAWMLFVLIWPLTWLFSEGVVRFLRVSPDIEQLVARMFPIVAGLVLLNGLSEALEAVVSGCQRTGLVNVVGACAHALNYTAVIVLVLLGGGLWSLVVGQAIASCVRFGGAWVASRSSFGPVSLLPQLPQRTDITMARYSGLLMVGSLASALRDQTDKIVLASLASPTWVGYYGIAVRLSTLVMEIIRFVYLPILTAVGALNAMGDWDGVRKLYRQLMAVVSIVTGLIVVLVLGLADYLIVFWIGRPIPEVTPLLWWLMAGSALAAMLTGPGTAICRGCGRPGIETIYLAVNLALNLVLTVSLVLLIGPVGTAVATGSTWALSSILFLFVLHANVDLPVDASRRAAFTTVVAGVFAAAVYWVSGLMGLPEGRPQALWYCAVLGSLSAMGYFGALAMFRLMSVPDAVRGLRGLLRVAG
jgi:O-antigen/teichoic acid export membrane protein